jgi:hypothetical protein
MFNYSIVVFQEKGGIMPTQEHDRSSVLSIRLPDELIGRLDRYLDWNETRQHVKSSRNAALRAALSWWLDDQEQLVGLSTSETLHRQFRTACHTLRHTPHDVYIYRLREGLGWPKERFDTVLEHFRAQGQVALEPGTPSQMSAEHIRDSYHVYGQLYLTLRWRDGADLDRSPSESLS